MMTYLTATSEVLLCAQNVIRAIILDISLLIAHCGNNHPLQPHILPLPSLHIQLFQGRPFLPPSGSSPAPIRTLFEPAISSTTMVNVTTPIASTPINVVLATDNTLNVTAQENGLLANNFTPLPVNIITPINVNFLRACLLNHPNRTFVNFLLDGFTNGFDIGYTGDITWGRRSNLLSARNNSIAVSKAISTELQRGHTSGPFDLAPFHVLHCSPLGAVPKKDGSHRIILDLSSPRGSSINDGIWLDKFYVDTRLPFGSRSSPFIFNQFADALLWILFTVFGIQFIIHYLDDFLICGDTEQSCKHDMDVMQSAFFKLGVPLAPDKIVGPSQSITYLGININSVSQTISLPHDKLSDLRSTLATWSHCKKCTKRELLSLIGSLSFASKVVKPGRMFLRRLIDLSTTVSELSHHISLNAEAQADIWWWNSFLPSWNGVEFIQQTPISSHSLRLFTDASSHGFGAVYGNEWFSVPWPSSFSHHHINFLELFAIVASVFTWGNNWRNKQILFFTDNSSITYVWKTGTCRDKNIMRLVRALFMFTASRNINILMHHIPGQSNLLADLLSRLQVQKFHQAHPQALLQPAIVSADVWHLC